MFSLVLDATTANIAMFSIAAHADEREAHLRCPEASGQSVIRMDFWKGEVIAPSEEELLS
jgi:hypothetical protein